MIRTGGSRKHRSWDDRDEEESKSIGDKMSDWSKGERAELPFKRNQKLGFWPVVSHLT
jgi:hypothetical protein